MTTELNCEIVKDLLPNYIEGLTSDETAAAVKAHIEGCEACRGIYREMTGSEPTVSAEPEIDYLKKVKKTNKTRVGILALCAFCAALAAGLIFALSRVNAKKPKAIYDANTNSVVVTGTGGYDKVKLPDETDTASTLDVQDDEFHLSMYIPFLQSKWETPMKQYLPGYIDRTEKSLAFIRDYIKENAASVYPAELADKPVDIDVRENNDYVYRNEADRIRLTLDKFYWHREELYLLAIMNADSVEWPQLGYAWYVGLCIDPYFEMDAGASLMGDEPYYDICVKAGVDMSRITNKDMRTVSDAVSYVCLTKGLSRWGSAYESTALSLTPLYTGPRGASGPNTKMSVIMAQSFVAWLDEHYGFENVSAFCFGQKRFDEAFGTDFDTAFGEWSAWILETYAE